LPARFGICRIFLGWHDVSPVTLYSYRGYNPVVELLLKIGSVVPKNVVVLARIEMHILFGTIVPAINADEISAACAVVI
jgi:hypothetical protein